MKICPSCLENLENCNFYKDSTRKDSMRTYCKNCTKTKFSDSRKKYYLKNKEKFTKKSKEWAEKNRDKSRKYKKKYKDKKIIEIKNLINSYKKECLICKEQDIRCLELHHMNKEDKKFLVSNMKYSITNIPIIIKEINKCVCLCSNCHRKEHFKNFKGKFWKFKYIQEIKSKSSCIKCGESHWSCLDFHHKNPEDKVLNIGAMVRDKKYSIEDIQNEIYKCEIICSNCHRKEHFR